MVQLGIRRGVAVAEPGGADSKWLRQRALAGGGSGGAESGWPLEGFFGL